MSNPLGALKIDHWYKAVLVIAVAVLLVSLTVPLQGVENPSVAITALGATFLGMGEWRNHPLQTRVGVGFTLTSHPRKLTLTGSLLDALGIVLVVIGVLRLLA